MVQADLLRREEHRRIAAEQDRDELLVVLGCARKKLGEVKYYAGIETPPRGESTRAKPRAAAADAQSRLSDVRAPLRLLPETRGLSIFFFPSAH